MTKNFKTEHLTIMFTDIKGFTSKTSLKSREELHRLLELHEELIKPIFFEYKGRVIKTIGDAFLVTFKSPTDAVLCGIKIQEVLKQYNKSINDANEKLEIRVAINAGEVTIKDKDVFGEAVNIASRIEGIAEANEIYFTESVYLSMNKNEIPSAEIGLRHLKGIADPVKVYKVLDEIVSESILHKKRAESLADKQKDESKFKLKIKKKYLIVAAIIFLLLIFGVIVRNIKNESTTNIIADANAAIESGDREKALNYIEQLEDQNFEILPVEDLLAVSKLYQFADDKFSAVKILRIAMGKKPNLDQIIEIAKLNIWIIANSPQGSWEREEAILIMKDILKNPKFPEDMRKNALEMIEKSAENKRIMPGIIK